jgi:polysaccharide export outer membrane protein
MTSTTRGMIEMRNEVLCAVFAVSVLPFSIGDGGFAQQSGMQSTIGSQSGATASRSRTDAAAAIRSAGLVAVPADFAQLKLAPGFLLSLNVLDDPDFAGSFRVDEQGNIALPILGTLRVGGETISEASVQIGKRLLEEEILKDPQVDLSVLEYSAPEVTIVGEVASPGKYSLLVPHNLVDVLALAGGTTIAAGNEVQITRGNLNEEPFLVHFSKATDPKAVENAIVNPGDTVKVRRAGIVYVLGAVTRPGGFVMQEDGALNVLQAISLAGGTSIPASVSTIYLLRRNADGTEVRIALPFNKMQHGRITDMELHATDILYVPNSKIKSTLIYSQGILTAATSATIYAAAVY